MSTRLILFCGVLVGLAGILFHGELTGETTAHTGMVTYVDGTLKKKFMEAEEWSPADKDTTVAAGDKVRTMHMSRAEIQLKELDILRLAPKTTIDIIKLFEETKEKKDRTEINVEGGDIWAMVGEVKTGSEFNVNTQVAGAAITGTVFRMSVDQDSSAELKVYRGEVQITNAPLNKNLKPQPMPFIKPGRIPGPQQVPGPRQVSLDEWIYIVKEMQSIKIGGRGDLISSGDFTSEDPEEKTDWVRWNRERDESWREKK